MQDWKYLDGEEEELGWPAIAVLAVVVLAACWLSYCVAAAYLPTM